MGRCECGGETVWNDMCEYCLHDWEEQMYDDREYEACNYVEELQIKYSYKYEVVKIISEDRKFLGDLVEFLNSYKPTPGKETKIIISNTNDMDDNNESSS